jgi:hypothetical protein
MNPILKKILYWTPRVASILFVLFISLFALDVFDTGAGFWETLLALVIHLVPSFILIVALILAWKLEWIGALLYIGFAGWYIIEMWGQFPWTVYLLLAGIPFVIGAFFAVNWFLRGKIRAG